MLGAGTKPKDGLVPRPGWGTASASLFASEGGSEAWEVGSWGRPSRCPQRGGGNGAQFPLGLSPSARAVRLCQNMGVALLLSGVTGSARPTGTSISCLLFPGSFDFHHRGRCQASALPLHKVNFPRRYAMPDIWRERSGRPSKPGVSHGRLSGRALCPEVQ